MNEVVYLYQPRGYFPGYCYRRFEDAVSQLLKDEQVNSITELILSLEEYDVWHDIDIAGRSVSIDDGARITEIDLR